MRACLTQASTQNTTNLISVGRDNWYPVLFPLKKTAFSIGIRSVHLILNAMELDVICPARRLRIPRNCKTIGHFSIENHHLSGAIPHYLCIFSRRSKSSWHLLFYYFYVAIGSTNGRPGCTCTWSPQNHHFSKAKNLQFLLKNLHVYISKRTGRKHSRRILFIH